MKNPKIKPLKHIYLLSEIPFYKELSVIKTNHAFKGYTMPCKVELVERKYPISQLEASKSSIKDLLNNFLDETNDFKYLITLEVVLKNTKTMKLNFLLFIPLRQQKQ